MQAAVSIVHVWPSHRAVGHIYNNIKAKRFNFKLGWGMKELVCLLLFTCNYVVSVRRGFLFLWVLGMSYVILLWHSPSLPYNYYAKN